MQKKSIFWYLTAPLRFLYKIYFLLVFFALAFLLYPFFFVLLRSKRHVHKAFKLKRIWAKLLLVLTWVRVKIDGKENLVKEPCVICANHASYLDIVVMFVAIPTTFLFLGKAELLKWPVVRIFFRNMDIPVDRSNSFKARESIEQTKEAIQKGFSIAIFPEGLIPVENVPKMKPFKRGAFVLAMSQEAPIQPITFSTNWKLFATESHPFGAGCPGVSKVVIHPAIETKGLEENQMTRLIQQTYEVIESGMENEKKSR